MRRHLAVVHEPPVTDWTGVCPFLHWGVLSDGVRCEFGLPKEALIADSAHEEFLLVRQVCLSVQFEAVSC